MDYVTNVQEKISKTVIPMPRAWLTDALVKMVTVVMESLAATSMNAKKDMMCAELVDAVILKEISTAHAQTDTDLLQSQRSVWTLMNVANHRASTCVTAQERVAPIQMAVMLASVSILLYFLILMMANNKYLSQSLEL